MFQQGMAALETYLRSWIFIKTVLITSWVLFVSVIHYIYDYEFCVHILFVSIHTTYMTFLCLDVQFTILAFVGFTKGILGTRKMEPYIRYTEMIAVITLLVATGAMAMSWPFRHLCPYLKIRSWYVFSYSTLYHILLVVGFVWIALNSYIAWKIARFKHRKDNLIQKVGCIYITRQTITETAETTPPNIDADVNDEGTVSLVNLPTICQ